MIKLQPTKVRRLYLINRPQWSLAGEYSFRMSDIVDFELGYGKHLVVPLNVYIGVSSKH